LGSVIDVKSEQLDAIEILIGGSPCQSFSFCGKRNGMSTVDKQEVLTLEHYLQLKSENYKFDGQSYLFWEYVRLLKEAKPKYLLLENVRMTKKWQDVISKTLGVEPIVINSSNLSAQNRVRLYWTNIPNVTQPEDKGIMLKDIVEKDGNFEFVHEEIFRSGFKRGLSWQYDGTGKGFNSQNYRAYFLDGKMGCLSHSAPHGAKILTENGVRKTTRKEHERLQNVPENYTACIELNKAKAALGNGWTVDVIAHILSFLPDEYKNVTA
jgi:DNA (cytosine-5)-methyltransferase 3A